MDPHSLPPYPIRNTPASGPELACLGQWCIRSGPRLHIIRPGRRANLLALLLLNAGRAVQTRELIAEVWPEEHPAKMENDFYAHIVRLRNDIAGWGAGTGVRLDSCKPGYRLRLGGTGFDLYRYRELVAQAARVRDRAPEGSLALARRAVGLWTGTPFSGMSLGPAATVAVVRLEEDHLNLVIDTNDLALSLGHHSVLLPELEELTLRHPYCERFYDQLMVAQYRAGRTDAVVRAYSRLCRVLDQDLGMTPSPMIERRYVAILRHDSAMDPQPSGIPAGWSPVAT